MQNVYPRSTVRSRGRGVLISVGMAGLIVIGLLGFWWESAMRIPTVTIPNPTLPTPNAFDFYVAAGNAVVNGKQIDDALGTKPILVLSHVQKEALVQQNLGVFHTIHQGFAYPYLNPPARSWDALFPYYARFRAVARLMAFQEQVRAESGKWGGAADSSLDAMRMGADIPYGSCMIGDLVGIACQTIGRRPMWSVVEHLNAAESRAAISRVTQIINRQLPYANALQEQKWAMQASLLEVFRETKKPSTQTADDTNDPRSMDKGSSTAMYLLFSKSRIMRDYTHYMDQIIDQARRPYGLHPLPPPEPRDPINRMIIPVYTEAWLKDVDNETQNALLLVTLALHSFRLEQGHYPVTLSELAPAYLKSLPIDPFALKGTLQYYLNGQKYVLYSVGPDGKDDGGAPIDVLKSAERSLSPSISGTPPPAPVNVSKSADSTEHINASARYTYHDYYVHENSVGDVVAGKNL